MYNLNTFSSYLDLKEIIDEHIDFYNNVRLAKRFNNQTPLEVRAQVFKSHKPNFYPTRLTIK